MRTLGCGSFVLGQLLIAGVGLQADDQADAKAIIDKAIKAMGGEEKLAKYKATTSKGKGKGNILGNELDFTFEAAAQPPKQFRRRIALDINGTKFERIDVVNGDKGWFSTMGNTEDMSPDQLTAEREDLYAGWVATLVPLKEPAFKLSPVPEAKVGDRPAV